VQFYRAIFEVLEAEFPPRAGSPPATSAVLGRFLDVLGWTLLNDPQVREDAALQACADVLQAELGCSGLKARDLSESCLAFWQALGVVERVHHGGDQALTFIHKTFGEFTAGRYLASLPTFRQAKILAAQDDVSALNEAIVFASGLGAGPVFVDALVRRGFAGPIGQARLLQALEVLAEADPIDPIRTQAVVEAAVDRLVGTHRTWAFETGAALARIAPRAPDLVAPLARPRSHAQAWTRVAGCAVLLATGADGLSFDALLSAMDSLTDPILTPTLGGSWALGGGPGRSLLLDFAYAVAERILAERSGAEAEELLKRFVPVINAGTFGFCSRLEELVTRHGLKLPLPESFPMYALGDWDLSKTGPTYRQAFGAMLRAIGGDDVRGATDEGPRGPLYVLAGFFEAIGVRESGMSDIQAWLQPFELADVAEVYRQVARLADLPQDRLAAESAELRGDIAATETSFLMIFDRTPEVDMNELDPVRLAGTAIDFGCVERALLHASSLVVTPALNLTLLAGSADVWRRIAKGLLARGSDAALWAAGHLAAKLPECETLDLLLAHAAAPPRPGTAHVIDQLAKYCPFDDPRRVEALRSALLSNEVEAAVAAAKWALAAPNINSETEAALLREAFIHWISVERPYPQAGGVIPPSPRAALLSVLYDMGRLDFETLRERLTDTRSDVVGAAGVALVDRIDGDAGPRHLRRPRPVGPDSDECPEECLSQMRRFHPGRTSTSVGVVGKSRRKFAFHCHAPFGLFSCRIGDADSGTGAVAGRS
jgi:hypothetical protein